MEGTEKQKERKEKHYAVGGQGETILLTTEVVQGHGGWGVAAVSTALVQECSDANPTKDHLSV